jgi:hypothetical protein
VERIFAHATRKESVARSTRRRPKRRRSAPGAVLRRFLAAVDGHKRASSSLGASPSTDAQLVTPAAFARRIVSPTAPALARTLSATCRWLRPSCHFCLSISLTSRMDSRSVGIVSPSRRTLRRTIQRRYPFRPPGTGREVITMTDLGDHEADPGDHDGPRRAIMIVRRTQIRHIQTRPSTFCSARYRAGAAASQSLCLPAHDRRSPTRGRRGDERHPRLAGARRHRDDKSVRRHQHPSERGRSPGVRPTSRRWRSAPQEAGMAK